MSVPDTHRRRRGVSRPFCSDRASYPHLYDHIATFIWIKIHINAYRPKCAVIYIQSLSYSIYVMLYCASHAIPVTPNTVGHMEGYSYRHAFFCGWACSTNCLLGCHKPIHASRNLCSLVRSPMTPPVSIWE